MMRWGQKAFRFGAAKVGRMGVKNNRYWKEKGGLKNIAVSRKFEKNDTTPCFFKTISTFALGQREILPFLESLF